MPKKVRVELEFDIGDIVFLITDIEQLERKVVEITLTPHAPIYLLACGTEQTQHYAIEITSERKVI